MSERLGGRPVVVGNDVNVGTLAEHRLGAGKGSTIFSVCSPALGSGRASSSTANREGPRGLAGEIGHIFVAFRDLAQQVEGLGRGELEDYAGRKALERRVIAAGAPDNEAMLALRSDGRLKSKAWAMAIEMNDPLARRLVDQAASALGHRHGVRHHHP